MTSFTSPEGSSRATRIAEYDRKIPKCALPKWTPGDTRRLEPTISTFEEERREALASVLHSLATEAPDPDRTAACLHLLRHLTCVPAYQ
jgi:hypothetical protein